MAGGTVRLVSGTDEILTAEAVRTAVSELVGDANRADVLDEYSDDQYTLSDLAISASTPPMLASHRVVVGRGLSRFGAAELTPLINWLDDPCPTTDLVLEWDAAPCASSAPRSCRGRRWPADRVRRARRGA